MNIDVFNGENYMMHKTVLKLVIYYGSHISSNISIDFGLVTELKEKCVLLVYNTHHRQLMQDSTPPVNSLQGFLSILRHPSPHP